MISSFLLQDIPRHPDTRLFEVREAFKRSLSLGFQTHIRANIATFLVYLQHKVGRFSEKQAGTAAAAATQAPTPERTTSRIREMCELAQTPLVV